ncbi:MAG: hypothetical protein ACRDXX_11390 [Stackebrandtia sp.]
MSDHADAHRGDHTGEVMAGLEIVDVETPPGRAAAPPPSHEPAEPAYSAIQAMWDRVNTVRRYEPAPARWEPPRLVEPRSKWVAFPGLVLLALAAAFFCWASAEPFWLSTGHGVSGTVSVTTCDSGGLSQRCLGQFTPAGGGDTMFGVRVAGDPEVERDGAQLDGQVVSERAGTAYVADDAGLRLRAAAGLAMVLACGLGVAFVTGAWRWRGRDRLAAVSLSLGAPVGLWLTTLGVTFW